MSFSFELKYKIYIEIIVKYYSQPTRMLKNTAISLDNFYCTWNDVSIGCALSSSSSETM